MSYVLVKNNDWATVTCNNVQVSIPKVWHIAKLRDSVKSYIGGDYGDDTDGEDKSEVDVYTLHVFNTNYEKAIAKRYLRTSKLKGRALDVGDILLEKCGGSPKNPVGRMYQLTKASTRPRTAVNFITILKLVECVDAKYLYAHLRYLYKNGVTRLYEQKTTGIANLKTEDFLNHEIQKPSSLVEQTAIANILSDQEALIAQYDNLIALHEKRFAYLSDELLSGRVRLVQKEVGEVELVKNNDWRKSVVNAVVMDIPLEWKTLKLKELCTNPVTKGTTPSSIGHHFLDSGTVNFYKVENLKHNQLLRSNVYISPECHASLKRSQLQAYDLLFSIAGTIGNVGLVTEHHLPGNVNQAIAIIRPTQKGQSLYLLYLMRNFIESMTAKKLGNVIPNFNLEMLKTVEILLPPIEEQTLIAQVLSDQEALIAQYKKLRDAEKKRFDWLSDALLSGTYRVKVEA